MSKDTYFLIYCSDGDTCVAEKTKEEILEMTDEEEGEEFMDHIVDRDTNYWADLNLVIKGKIVCPKPKKVVEEWEIE